MTARFRILREALQRAHLRAANTPQPLGSEPPPLADIDPAEAHRPVGVVAATEAGEPPACSCGAPVWPHDTDGRHVKLTIPGQCPTGEPSCDGSCDTKRLPDPDDTDVAEEEIDRMMAEGTPVQIDPPPSGESPDGPGESPDGKPGRLPGLDERVTTAVLDALKQLKRADKITVNLSTRAVPEAIASTVLAEVHRVTPADREQLREQYAEAFARYDWNVAPLFKRVTPNADHYSVADEVMAVRDREMEQLRAERDELRNETAIQRGVIADYRVENTALRDKLTVQAAEAQQPEPTASPTDEDILAAAEKALEGVLLPATWRAWLGRALDAVLAAIVPLVAQLRRERDLAIARGLAADLAESRASVVLDCPEPDAASTLLEQRHTPAGREQLRDRHAAARHQRYAEVLRRWGLLDEVNNPEATAAYVTTDLLAVADTEIRAALEQARARLDNLREISRQQNDRLHGELEQLRAGEEPIPDDHDPAIALTPGQWITRWNQATPEERLNVAAGQLYADRLAFKLNEARAELEQLRARMQAVADGDTEMPDYIERDKLRDALDGTGQPTDTSTCQEGTQR